MTLWNRSTVAFLVLLGLFAGCEEIASRDDPREADNDVTDDIETGRCTGSRLLCEARPAEQCENSCEVVDSCQHPDKQRCLSHLDEARCNLDELCTWNLVFCDLIASDSCGANSDETSCLEDPLGTCVWQGRCTGLADGCNEAEDEETCESNIGCEWVVE